MANFGTDSNGFQFYITTIKTGCAKHWDSLHQAIPGRAPQHAGSGWRAAWNQGGLSQRVLSDIDLHMAALALELCSTIMVDRRSIKNIGLAVRHTVLHDTLVLIRSAMLQGQAVQGKQRYYITRREAQEYEREVKAARLREAAIQAVAAASQYNPHYDFGYHPDQPWE